jgi:hypothetical protein
MVTVGCPADSMEGGLDFYCQRGWAYTDHCSYIADNLAGAPGAPKAAEINAKWVFGTKWDPL